MRNYPQRNEGQLYIKITPMFKQLSASQLFEAVTLAMDWFEEAIPEKHDRFYSMREIAEVFETRTHGETELTRLLEFCSFLKSPPPIVRAQEAHPDEPDVIEIPFDNLDPREELLEEAFLRDEQPEALD